MNKNFFILLSFILFFTCFDFAYAEKSSFQHIILGEGPTRYIISEIKDESVEIKAVGEGSASGLYSENLHHFFNKSDILEWSWRIDDIQKNADIAVKDKEDFAASIQLVFGKKTLFSRPKVLVYGWVGNDAMLGHVIKSPRASRHFRTLILDNVSSPLSKWQRHKRNIIDDYKSVYGEAPSEPLSVIGVFTDNDQTREDVTSFYRLNFRP
ncbi:MAG: DUF3047 domain-containing protein [Bdellovibrionales bacterium]